MSHLPAFCFFIQSCRPVLLWPLDWSRPLGWMDAWMDGSMAGWMHGWMDAWMDGCMAGWFMVVVALVAVVVLGGDGWGSEWLHLWLHG